MMKRINGIEPELFGVSSELLAYRLGRTDFMFALLAAVFTAAWQAWRCAFHPNVVGLLVGSAFSVAFFLVCRTLLPLFLNATVSNLLRYRFALLLINLSAVAVVVQTDAFGEICSRTDKNAIITLLAVSVPALYLWYIRLGGRIWLFLACITAGFLLGFGSIGLAVFGVLLALHLFLGFRFSHAEDAMTTDESYGKTFIHVMQPVFQHHADAGACRFAATLFILLGIGLSVATCALVVDGHFSGHAFANVMLERFRGSIAINLNSFAALACALGAFFLACFFAATATDVYRPLMGSLFMLYGFGIILPYCYVADVFARIGLPHVMDVPGLTLFVAALFGIVLMISGAVFIVEIGCRRDEIIRAIGETDDRSTSRQWGTFALSSVIILLTLALSFLK